MHATRLVAMLSTASLVLTVPSLGQTPAPMTVSVTWLVQHLHDKDLVLLHIGDGAEYVAKHIPGARLVSLTSISVSDHASPQGLMLELPSTPALHDSLAALGISDRSRVIVYFGNDWVTPSTRVIFTLDYAGLGGQVSLLDGGMPAWVRAGHPVTAAVTPARPGTLSPLRVQSSLVASAEYVHDHIGKPGVKIIDARDSSFYLGVQYGQANRAGHIPSAASLPYVEITDDNLLLRSREDLIARFEKAGVQPGDTVVTYCHVGAQATLPLFAARLLGHPVKLYDGSFQDWSRHTEYAVDAAATKP